ncbi:serine palmitoyltransferase small subunit A [Achroia grisella]|uniref:serine palmitoyltransferase small subunit A n=1 Tax=Achroia grisella TaxID=688607 RepID=UPI0027D206F0|nr:serine palmitoyltransferase small subunit A [Achroia grisella]
MTNLIQNIKKFFTYWYLRYLLVTELYMVETWEKIVIQSIFVIIFGLYSYFNYSILTHGVSHLGRTLQNTE